MHLSLNSTEPRVLLGLVLGDNYGQAGAINYYSKKSIKVVSFHADYINGFVFDHPYKHQIRVSTIDEDSYELEETGPYFLFGELSDSITNPYAREFKTMIFVFKNARINVNERIKYEIKGVKNKAVTENHLPTSRLSQYLI